MSGEAARGVLQRIVQVVEAKPDDQPGQGGWVRIKLICHENGSSAATEYHTMPQAEFEVLLRSGYLPG